jgi:hypothetical protein
MLTQHARAVVWHDVCTHSDVCEHVSIFYNQKKYVACVGYI